jgi:hypothetical protein
MFLEFHLEIPGFKKSQLKRLVRKNLKRVFLQTTFFKMAAVTSQNLFCRLASNLMCTFTANVITVGTKNKNENVLFLTLGTLITSEKSNIFFIFFVFNVGHTDFRR